MPNKIIAYGLVRREFGFDGSFDKEQDTDALGLAAAFKDQRTLLEADAFEVIRRDSTTIKSKHLPLLRSPFNAGKAIDCIALSERNDIAAVCGNGIVVLLDCISYKQVTSLKVGPNSGTFAAFCKNDTQLIVAAGQEICFYDLARSAHWDTSVLSFSEGWAEKTAEIRNLYVELDSSTIAADLQLKYPSDKLPNGQSRIIFTGNELNRKHDAVFATRNEAILNPQIVGHAINRPFPVIVNTDQGARTSIKGKIDYKNALSKWILTKNGKAVLRLLKIPLSQDSIESELGVCQVWDSVSGKKICQIENVDAAIEQRRTGFVDAICGNQNIILISSDGSIHIVNEGSFQRTAVVSVASGRVVSACHARNESLGIVGTDSGRLAVVDLAQGMETFAQQVSNYSITALTEVVPGIIAAGNDLGEVLLFRHEDGKFINLCRLGKMSSSVASLEVSGDGKLLAITALEEPGARFVDLHSFNAFLDELGLGIR